jgi:hypothetical protein
VQTAAYCDNEADLQVAWQIWRSWRAVDTP